MEEFWKESREAFLKQVTEMAIRAGTETPLPKFRALSSGIPLSQAKTKMEAVLAVDIGGTATKVGIRLDGQSQPWRVLLEDPNNSFQNETETGNSLERFAAMVASRTLEMLKQQGINVASWGLGIVWSNAMNNPVIPGFGIDGVVTARAYYSKGEWFCRDVKDGDSVGRVFRDAFVKVGIPVSLTLVANDTPLTLKALPSANAGMVVSTGFNTTIVKNGESGGVICNAESGTSFVIGTELVEPLDLVNPNTPASIIEHLVSGQNLPRLFASYLIADTSNYPAFKEVSKNLKGMGKAAFDFFSAPDISDCLDRPEKFLGKCKALANVSPDNLPAYQSLAKNLLRRSARLSAFVAYASVVEQLDDRDSFIIALDSSLSRNIPFFWKTFQESLKEITPPNKSITLKLVDRQEAPGGILSVPMLGAANALDALAEI